MATMGAKPVSVPAHLASAAASGQSVFVDTNVLVYATAPSAPEHMAAREAIDGLSHAGLPFWLSRQVLREYIAAMTRPQAFAPAGSMTLVLQNIQAFLTAFRIAEDGPTVTAGLLNLLSQVACAGKQVHDANIVATMVAHGIPNLLTNNPSDFYRFAGFITVLPLVPPAPPPVPAAAPPPPTPGAP